MHWRIELPRGSSLRACGALLRQSRLGSLDNIAIEPTDMVTIIYQMYNNGSDHAPDVGLVGGAI
jgi:hypothetical protein